MLHKTQSLNVPLKPPKHCRYNDDHQNLVICGAKMGKSKGAKKSEAAQPPKITKKESASPSTGVSRRPAARSTERHQLVVWLTLRGLAIIYLWFFVSSLAQIRNKYPLDNLKQAYSNAEALQTRVKQSKPRVTIPTVFGLLDDAGVSPIASIYSSVVTGAASSLLMLLGVSWTPIVFFLWCVSYFLPLSLTFLRHASAFSSYSSDNTAL
jgi:hypothetical protein